MVHGTLECPPMHTHGLTLCFSIFLGHLELLIQFQHLNIQTEIQALEHKFLPLSSVIARNTVEVGFRLQSSLLCLGLPWDVSNPLL